jgi:hypothetical protein
MNQLFAGEIFEIVHKEIRHKIPESNRLQWNLPVKKSPLSRREDFLMLESRKRGLV